jgi:hypothetical protein
MNKSQNMSVWLNKMVLASHFCIVSPEPTTYLKGIANVPREELRVSLHASQPSHLPKKLIQIPNKGKLIVRKIVTLEVTSN